MLVLYRCLMLNFTYFCELSKVNLPLTQRLLGLVPHETELFWIQQRKQSHMVKGNTSRETNFHVNRQKWCCLNVTWPLKTHVGLVFDSWIAKCWHLRHSYSFLLWKQILFTWFLLQLLKSDRFLFWEQMFCQHPSLCTVYTRSKDGGDCCGETAFTSSQDVLNWVFGLRLVQGHAWITEQPSQYLKTFFKFIFTEQTWQRLASVYDRPIKSHHHISRQSKYRGVSNFTTAVFWERSFYSALSTRNLLWNAQGGKK